MGCRANCPTASKTLPRILNEESLLIDKMISKLFWLIFAILGMQTKEGDTYYGGTNTISKKL